MTTHAPPLRSQRWFGGADLNGFLHRAWIKAEGFSEDAFQGRPVIGVANSWSEATNCNAHLRTVAEHVKRGVWRAGGFPLEFPVISLCEPLMKPTTMLFRNLMSMDVEECIRSLPFDGVVLLSGCDKTTPAMLMGAASADVPGDHGHGRPHAARDVRDRGGGLRAPTSGATGTSFAPAGSTRRPGASWRAASRARPATAWSWGRPRRWPRWPSRWG